MGGFLGDINAGYDRDRNMAYIVFGARKELNKLRLEPGLLLSDVKQVEVISVEVEG